MRTDPSVNNGNPIYYAQDHEGSVTHLLNGCTAPSSQTGNVLEKYAYDAFGVATFMDSNGNNLNPPATAFNNRFLFTGREYAATYRGTYISTFSFYEYRARAYNPNLGRFMSEDPKGFVRRIGLGTSPADWSLVSHPDEGEFNLFRYCGNDPIDFTDPMGLDYGDPFGSPDAAARDFNAIYNPKSIHNNTEFGASIYKLSGRYSYAKPIEGTFHDSHKRNSIPDHATLVGDIHSHGDYSRGYTDKDGHLDRADRVSRTNPNYRALDNFDSDRPSAPDKRYWHTAGQGKDEYTGYLRYRPVVRCGNRTA